jgi:peptidoglycan/xylan/chitin deacetylase (PgdA/CDA1 family)
MTWIDPISRRLHRGTGQHRPLILLYHAVSPGKRKPAWPWAISMQQFCDQIDFLTSEGYSTPTVAELIAKNTTTSWSGRTAVITFDDGYANNRAACEALQKRGMRATWFIVCGSLGQSPKWSEDGRPDGRLLKSSELRSMLECGMEIGSHTVNHVRLTQSDYAHLMHELTDSKTMLEDALGQPVTSFAYPYGASDLRCVEAVKQAGYSAACTTAPGWAFLDKDSFRLRRLTIFNTDTVNILARKISLGSNNVGWSEIARYALRRITEKNFEIRPFRPHA